MSVIHSALKKAEEEQRRRLEPYNLSIDAIVELAQNKSKTGISPRPARQTEPAPQPVPVIQVGRKDKSYLSLRVFLWTLAGAVLFLGLIFFAANQLSHRRPHKVTAPARVLQKADGLRTQGKKQIHLVQERMVATPIGIFSITGVVNSGGEWNAMINNKLVAVGSMIDGAKVVSIYEGAATLEMNGKRFTIYLD